MLVSIYLATRNRATMLARAVESCLQQTHTEFELIVVDDGSSDQTASVLAGFAARDERVTVIRFAESMGACVARNAALQMARADWVTGLDDDDYFLPHRLSDFVQFDSKPYAFLCSNFLELNEFGTFPIRKTRTVISFDDIKRRNYVGNQIFARKERVLELGGFDPGAPAWQDYDLWFRLIRKYGSAFKLYNNSMVLNTLDKPTSITATSAADGYRYFICKHQQDLTERDLDFQWVNDAINQQRDISWLEVLRRSRNLESFTRLAIRSLMKYRLIRKILFALYSVFNRREI